MSMKSPLDYWWEKGLKEGLEEGLEEGIETRQIKDIEALMETMQEM